jgi:hypothetical protein
MPSKRKFVRAKSHLKQNLTKSKIWFGRESDLFVRENLSLKLSQFEWILYGKDGEIARGKYGSNMMAEINSFLL